MKCVSRVSFVGLSIVFSLQFMFHSHPKTYKIQWKSHRAQCLRGISLLNSTLILFVTLLSIVKFILFFSVSFVPSKHSRSLISFVSHSITPSAKALKLVIYTEQPLFCYFLLIALFTYNEPICVCIFCVFRAWHGYLICVFLDIITNIRK